MLQVFEADLFFCVGLWELYRLQHPIHCLCLELLVCCVRFCVICSLWQVTNLPLTGAVVLCLEICADPRDMLCQLRCAGHRDSKRRDDCGRLQFQCHRRTGGRILYSEAECFQGLVRFQESSKNLVKWAQVFWTHGEILKLVTYLLWWNTVHLVGRINETIWHVFGKEPEMLWLMDLRSSDCQAQNPETWNLIQYDRNDNPKNTPK